MQPCAKVEYDYSRDARITPQGNLGYDSYAQRARRTQCLKPWTILIYMDADNDLKPYAYWDLHEMEASGVNNSTTIGSTTRSDVVVSLDTGSEFTRRLHVFRSPSERYRPGLTKRDFQNLDEGSIQSPIAMRVSKNFVVTPSEKLAQFLSWGIRHYPAQHYMIVVWGHGNGWTNNRKLFFTPFKDKAYIDSLSLASVLRQTVSNDLEGRPVDIYVADACFMQTLEVVHELGSSARFIIGTAQIEPFLGLPYRKIIREITLGRFADQASQSKDEAYRMALMIPHVFKESLEATSRIQPDAQDWITMSAVDSQSVETSLVPSLIRLSRTLREYLLEQPLRGVSLRFTLSDAARQSSGFRGGFKDLGSVLGLLQHQLESESFQKELWSPLTEKLQSQVGEVRTALEKSIVSAAFGRRYLSQAGFKGLSIWIADSAQEYQARRQDFMQSQFYQTAATWVQWQDFFFETSQPAPTTTAGF